MKIETMRNTRIAKKKEKVKQKHFYWSTIFGELEFEYFGGSDVMNKLII